MPHLGIKIRDNFGKATDIPAEAEVVAYTMRVDSPYALGLNFLPYKQKRQAKTPEELRDMAVARGWLPTVIFKVAEQNQFVMGYDELAAAGGLVYRRLTASEWGKAAKVPHRRSASLRVYRQVEDKWDVECLGPYGMDRWPVVGPENLTDTVRTLSRQILANGHYENTPILADALQDTGFSNEHVLDCLRAEPGPSMGSKRRWGVDIIIKGARLNDHLKGQVFNSGDDLVDSGDGD